jgi:SsrA-binding protein
MAALEGRKVVATNRRARHDYAILDTVEAGLVLTGSEIKSVRAGRVSLAEAHAALDDDELWLVNSHIASYAQAGYADHEPTRRRKLLLHGDEIAKLSSKVRQKGYTLVPLSLYLRRGWAKVELGLARGKRQYDKRETIRRRDMEREIEREVRRRGSKS